MEVDLYRTDDYIKTEETVPLLPLLRSTFERLLGQSLAGARFWLTFLPVPDDSVLEGKPAIVNLRRSHGYLTVRISRNGIVLYQHPHSVQELIAEPLQRMLAAQVPEEQHWGFGIVGAGVEGALIRPKPQVVGSVDIPVRSVHPRMFHMEEIPESDLPLITPTQLGVTEAFSDHPPVSIVLLPQVYRELRTTMPFSQEVEEGGFFFGQPFRNENHPESYLILITVAVPAERTGASFLHFTFTGDSFLRVEDMLAKRGRGEKLVGWYHSHLFAASDALGLSSIDVELHTDTFRRPWQVAGLLNISAGSRLIRFYSGGDSRMILAPYQVATR